MENFLKILKILILIVFVIKLFGILSVTADDSDSGSSSEENSNEDNMYVSKRSTVAELEGLEGWRAYNVGVLMASSLGK